MECIICCNLRTYLIPCQFCNIKVCYNCWHKHFLTLITDPKCLDCKNELSSEFLYAHFTKNFINNTLVKAKQLWLIEYYKSQLLDVSLKISIYQTSIKNDYLFCKTCLVPFFNKGWLPIPTTNLLPMYIPQCPGCTGKLMAMPLLFQDRLYDYYLKKINVETKIKEDVISCPKDKCYGLIRENACTICLTRFCTQCYDLQMENHVCKETDLESIRNIKKSSKRCPSCGIHITKVSGCSQMWCVKCHTAFDYDTCLIVKTDAIHNPHYFEYLQEYQPSEYINLSSKGMELLRRTIHVRDVSIPYVRSKMITFEEITIQSVKFLIKQIAEEKWIGYIKRSIKKNKYNSVLLQIYNTFLSLAYNILQNPSNDDDIQNLYLIITDYTEKEIKKIGSTAIPCSIFM